MNSQPPGGFYATHIRGDGEAIAASHGKLQARIRNAADMCERHHHRRELLAEAVEHALKHGKLGKQTRRRLKAALKEAS